MLDPGTAVVEDEERVAGRALARQPGSGRVLLDIEPGRDRVELVGGDALEDGDLRELLGIGMHRCLREAREWAV